MKFLLVIKIRSSFWLLLKKPNPDKICLVLGERVLLGPTLLLKVGHDVAPGDGFGLEAEKGHGLAYPGLVVPQAPVSHSVGFPALEFVQPAVYFLIRPSEQNDGLQVMLFEG
jgi:hypothetical protein